MLSIKNNIMASNAARHLGTSYNSLSKSVERLSSGLRINSAKDDAAGLAVRELIRADVAALRQGSRNAADAVSMLQTAEGGLAVIDDLLVRMRELAEQAATGSYSAAQRTIMDEEFQQLAGEITRISENTEFNNNNLLNEAVEASQSGAFKISLGNGSSDTAQVISIDSADMTASGLGLGTPTGTYEIYALTGTNAYYVTDADASYIRNNGAVSRALEIQVDQILANKVDVAVANRVKESFTHATEALGSATVDAAYWLNDTGADAKFTVTIDGIAGEEVNAAFATANGLSGLATALTDDEGVVTLQDVKDAINLSFAGKVGQSGQSLENVADYVTVGANIGLKIEANDYGALTGDISINTTQLTWADDSAIDVTDWTVESAGYDGEMSLNELVAAVNTAYSGDTNGVNGGTMGDVASVGTLADGRMYLKLTANNAYADSLPANWAFDIETDGSDDVKFANGADLTGNLAWVQDGAPATGGMTSASIGTQDDAAASVAKLDAAIAAKDTYRAHLGYMMNRLEAAASVVDIQSENLLAAESRVSDVDVATEMAAMTRNQVLAQAGISMLAQANSMPQMALKLLG